MATSSHSSASTPDIAADSSFEDFCLRFGSLHVKVPEVENNVDQSDHDSSTNSIYSYASSQNGSNMNNNNNNNSNAHEISDFFQVENHTENNIWKEEDNQSLLNQGNRLNPFEINAGNREITGLNHHPYVAASGPSSCSVGYNNHHQSHQEGIFGISNNSGNNNKYSALNCYVQNNYKILELLKTESNVALLATCLEGSLTLQNLLASNHQVITRNIFSGVLEFLFVVITNQYGHYLFEKLIQSCDVYALYLIVAKITLDTSLLIQVSLNKNGAKSIKKLIKVLIKVRKPNLILNMIDSLSEGLNTLMIDRTGSSIIIKCLKRLDTQLNQKLCEKAVENCLQLATHEKGCIYLNEFITYIRGPYRDQLLETISINSLYLSQDPTGNYVVQHVLGLCNPVFTKKICCILSGHYVRLSSMVGGSHIVEKCLKSPWIDYPLDELVNSNKLGRLAADQFGNYVIQTALKVTKHAKSQIHEKLVMKLQQHRNILQYGYGVNVLALIDPNRAVKFKVEKACTATVDA